MSENKNPINDQLINPDVWTEKELLKHLYREFRTMGESLVSVKNDIDLLEKRSEELEKSVGIIENTSEVKELEINKRMNRNNTISSIVGAIIAGLAFWSAFFAGK